MPSFWVAPDFKLYFMAFASVPIWVIAYIYRHRTGHVCTLLNQFQTWFRNAGLNIERSVDHVVVNMDEELAPLTLNIKFHREQDASDFMDRIHGRKWQYQYPGTNKPFIGGDIKCSYARNVVLRRRVDPSATEARTYGPLTPADITRSPIFLYPYNDFYNRETRQLVPGLYRRLSEEHYGLVDRVT